MLNLFCSVLFYSICHSLTAAVLCCLCPSFTSVGVMLQINFAFTTSVKTIRVLAVLFLAASYIIIRFGVSVCLKYLASPPRNEGITSHFLTAHIFIWDFDSTVCFGSVYIIKLGIYMHVKVMKKSCTHLR